MTIKNDMNVEDLARLTQEEFATTRSEMATKAELGELRAEMQAGFRAVTDELTSVIRSTVSHGNEDIKEFLYPHLRSLDTVLVDMEHVKGRLAKVEEKLGIGQL